MPLGGLAPFITTFDQRPLRQTQVTAAPSAAAVTASDWRATLPILTGRYVTLRDLRPADALALVQLLTTEEVTRFLAAPPPTTVEEFETIY
jgi:hypothetical protein